MPERKQSSIHYKAVLTIPPGAFREVGDEDAERTIIVIAPTQKRAIAAITNHFIALTKATPEDLMQAGSEKWPVVKAG